MSELKDSKMVEEKRKRAEREFKDKVAALEKDANLERKGYFGQDAINIKYAKKELDKLK